MNKYLKQARFWQLNEHSILPFGKHLGKSVLQVFETEPNYIAFCLRNIPKFTLSVTGWKALVQSNLAYFQQEINNDLFKVHVDKSAEVRRILRYNSHFDAEENKPVEYFRNKICFIMQDRFIMAGSLKSSVKQVVYSAGEIVEVAERYSSLSSQEKELSSEEKNRIGFSVKIIDYKDAVVFRKYESIYHQAGVTVFEVFQRLAFGNVLLVLIMDWNNYRFLGSEGTEEWVGILPDDAACLLYIINSYLTVNEIVSARALTQDEITDAIEIAKARLARAEQARPDSQEFEDFWENYEYNDLTPEDYQDATVPVFGTVNHLEQLLDWYTLNRKAFPNKNLFKSTNLHDYEHRLQFTLHTDEVDTLTKQWYNSTQNLKTYEYRHARDSQRRLDYWRWYWRSESEGREESDSERENWEELTDGQEGDWEDWHEPNY